MTEHAILQLANQITKSFENNLYILGVFIDLSKAFDTANHSIILKTLETYGIRGRNLEWFQSYLKNRMQYILIDDENKTDFLSVACRVPRCPILEPFLFLLYVNEKFFNQMFADGTNLFFLYRDIPVLFAAVNSKLNIISQCFLANKLFLNLTKTKYSFFP